MEDLQEVQEVQELMEHKELLVQVEFCFRD
jgi:hypothetical protein